jgi:hypothetical protein
MCLVYKYKAIFISRNIKLENHVYIPRWQTMIVSRLWSKKVKLVFFFICILEHSKIKKKLMYCKYYEIFSIWMKKKIFNERAIYQTFDEMINESNFFRSSQTSWKLFKCERIRFFVTCLLELLKVHFTFVLIEWKVK